MCARLKFIPTKSVLICPVDDSLFNSAVIIIIPKLKNKLIPLYLIVQLIAASMTLQVIPYLEVLANQKLDYVPHNGSVFSLVDSFEYREGNDVQHLSSATADYYVIGWHTST